MNILESMRNVCQRGLRPLLPNLAILALAILGSLAESGSVQADMVLVGTQGGPFGKGRVLQYEGGAQWGDLSQGVDLGQAVMDIEMKDGVLYVSTQTRSGYGGWGGKGQVWRFDGSWTRIGELDNSVMALFFLEGTLYAATNRHRVYRYDEAYGKWALAGQYPGSGLRAAVVSRIRGREEAFLGELDRDTFFRFGQAEGLRYMDNFWRSCVYAMAEHAGAIYGCCWHGSWYRSRDGEHFSKMGIVGMDHHWALASFRGELYMGSGRGDGSSPGRLRAYDGRTLRIVRQFPVTRYAEGVTALGTSNDGRTLYIGLGMNDGYYSGDGQSQVWIYDGTNFTLVSGTDAFDGGVQTLFVAPDQRVRLELEHASPSILEPGGATIVSLGVKGILPAVAEGSLQWRLPAGWMDEPLDGPNGAHRRFATAIQAPRDASPGDYRIGASLGDSDVAWFTIPIVSRIKGHERSVYVHAQDSIRQIRAWDRGLEDEAIARSMPGVFDLTAAGFPPDVVTSRREMESQTVGSFSFSTGGRTYGYYSQWATEYAHLGYSYSLWENRSTNWASQWETQFRSLFEGNAALPDNAIRALSLDVDFTTGRASPKGDYPTNIANMGDTAPSSLSLLFQALDSGNAGQAVLQPDSATHFPMELPEGRGGPVRLGLALDLTLVPMWDSSWTWYSITHRRRVSYLYLTWGRRPELVLRYLRGQTPLDALRLVLDLHFQSDYRRARHVAGYLNAQYGRGIGAWRLPQMAARGGRH